MRILAARKTGISGRRMVGMALAFLLAGPGIVMAQDTGLGEGFSQGPERIGRSMSFSGIVIGIRNERTRRCHVLRVDRSDLDRGLGGGGWALLCSSSTKLEMGQAWDGTVEQVDTGWVRAGPRWRVVPLFDIP